MTRAEPNSSPAALNAPKMPSEQNTKTSLGRQSTIQLVVTRPAKRSERQARQLELLDRCRRSHRPDRAAPSSRTSRCCRFEIEHRVAERAVVLLQVPLVEDAIHARQHGRRAGRCSVSSRRRNVRPRTTRRSTRCRAPPARPCRTRRPPRRPACWLRARGSRRGRRRARAPGRSARPHRRRAGASAAPAAAAPSARAARTALLFRGALRCRGSIRRAARSRSPPRPATPAASAASTCFLLERVELRALEIEHADAAILQQERDRPARSARR